MTIIVGVVVALILGPGKEDKEDITIGELLKQLISGEEKVDE